MKRDHIWRRHGGLFTAIRHAACSRVATLGSTKVAWSKKSAGPTEGFSNSRARVTSRRTRRDAHARGVGLYNSESSVHRRSAVSQAALHDRSDTHTIARAQQRRRCPLALHAGVCSRWQRWLGDHTTTTGRGDSGPGRKRKRGLRCYCCYCRTNGGPEVQQDRATPILRFAWLQQWPRWRRRGK